MQIRKTPSITEMVNLWVSLHAELEQLRDENARFREALEHYARVDQDSAGFVWGGDRDTETARRALGYVLEES